MKHKTVWQQFAALPSEVQQQVVDFIAFLRSRHVPSRPRKTTKKTKLVEEAFIGMWRNREDLQDSSAWVRNLRDREWGKRGE